MKAAERSDGPGERLSLELRRGVVSLAALSVLRTPAYGYALLQTLVDAGVEVDQGTLYPLLRRLNEQGLLESDWTVEQERPRKYYRLSPEGARLLPVLEGDWHSIRDSLDRLLEASHPSTGPVPAGTAPSEEEPL